MTAVTATMDDGTPYTPVMFVGGRCYPMFTESAQPTHKVSKAQRARERRALGMTMRHGWRGHWQRR